MNRKLGTYTTTPNLSSETLFHFTNSFDNLKLILKNGFQARYIYEKLPGRNIAYMVKTVCFCDIPLGQIKEHVNWYGDYAIGINRAKAREVGISPVHYIHSKSPQYPKGSSKKDLDWFKNYQFTHYLKQVRGKQIFYRNSGSPFWKWKTFYNEREWRYFEPEVKAELIQYKQETEIEEHRQKLNDGSFPLLAISPQLIEYILIRDYKDLPQLVKILQSAKYKRYYDLLLTKVITISQIRKDF